MVPSLYRRHRRAAAVRTAELPLRNSQGAMADSGRGCTAPRCAPALGNPGSPGFPRFWAARSRAAEPLPLPVRAALSPSASRPFAHQFGCEPYDVGWRGVNLLEQSLDLGAVDWLHVKIEFARFGAELGIVHGGVEGRAQQTRPFLGDARRRRE